MKLDIFGTEYTIKNVTPKLMQTLNEKHEMPSNCSGIFVPATQEIIVEIPKWKNKVDKDHSTTKVLRHEIFHAIFYEIGRQDLCNDEVLIDTLATIYPKIEKVMNDTKDKIAYYKE